MNEHVAPDTLIITTNASRLRSSLHTFAPGVGPALLFCTIIFAGGSIAQAQFGLLLIPAILALVLAFICLAYAYALPFGTYRINSEGIAFCPANPRRKTKQLRWQDVEKVQWDLREVGFRAKPGSTALSIEWNWFPQEQAEAAVRRLEEILSPDFDLSPPPNELQRLRGARPPDLTAGHSATDALVLNTEAKGGASLIKVVMASLVYGLFFAALVIVLGFFADSSPRGAITIALIFFSGSLAFGILVAWSFQLGTYQMDHAGISYRNAWGIAESLRWQEVMRIEWEQGITSLKTMQRTLHLHWLTFPRDQADARKRRLKELLSPYFSFSSESEPAPDESNVSFLLRPSHGLKLLAISVFWLILVLGPLVSFAFLDYQRALEGSPRGRWLDWLPILWLLVVLSLALVAALFFGFRSARARQPSTKPRNKSKPIWRVRRSFTEREFHSFPLEGQES